MLTILEKQKLFVLILLTALSAVMIWFDKGQSAEWIGLIRWSTAIFMGANLGSKAVHAFAKNKKDTEKG